MGPKKQPAKKGAMKKKLAKKVTPKKVAPKKIAAKKTGYRGKNTKKKCTAKKKTGWTIRKAVAAFPQLTPKERAQIIKEWPLLPYWPRGEEKPIISKEVQRQKEKIAENENQSKRMAENIEQKRREDEKKRRMEEDKMGVILFSPVENVLKENVIDSVTMENCFETLSHKVYYPEAANEFNRFLLYKEDSPKPSQMQGLVLPLFVYFYFLLLPPCEAEDAESAAKDIVNAHYFYDVFFYYVRENHEDLIKQLHEVRHAKAFKEHPLFKKYWEKKYICELSDDAVKDLLSFLHNIRSTALVYVFTVHFECRTEDLHMGKSLWLTPKRRESKRLEQIREDVKNYFEMKYVYKNSSEDELEEQEFTDLAPDAKTKYAMELYAPISGTYASTELTIDRVNRTVDNYENDPLRIEVIGNFEDSFRLILATVVNIGKDNLLSLDLNCDSTEFCISLENSSLCVSSLNRKAIIKFKDKKKYHIKGHKAHKGKRFKAAEKNKDLSDVENDILEETVDESYRIDLKSMMKTEINIPAQVVKYLPNEPHILLTAHDREIHLFNTKTGEFASPFDCRDFPEGSEIFSVDFNSTGTTFATGNKDGSTYFWDYNSSELVQTFAGHAFPLSVIRFHPNDVFLATGSKDCIVRVWDVKAGRNLRSFLGHDNTIDQIAFSFDGKVMASADEMGKVILWDVNNLTLIAETTFNESDASYSDGFTNLNFYVGGFALGGFNYNKEVLLWDVRYFPNVCYKKKFRNIPLLSKVDKDGLWKVVLQKASK